MLGFQWENLGFLSWGPGFFKNDGHRQKKTSNYIDRNVPKKKSPVTNSWSIAKTKVWRQLFGRLFVRFLGALFHSATSTHLPNKKRNPQNPTSLQASLRTLPTACHRQCPPLVHQLAQLALSSQEVGASRWPQQQKELVEASVCSKAPTGRQLLRPPSVRRRLFHQAIFYRKKSGWCSSFFFWKDVSGSACFQNLMHRHKLCVLSILLFWL